MRFAAYSTAASMRRWCSSTSTVGDSPVVPTITMAAVPSATCQSMSAFRRGRSRPPSAAIGVTMATILPESMRSGAGKNAILPYGKGLLAPRADALQGGGPRLLHHQVLVGEHPQPAAHRFQQLARGEQVVRIGRLAEALVAAREGL